MRSLLAMSTTVPKKRVVGTANSLGLSPGTPKNLVCPVAKQELVLTE